MRDTEQQPTPEQLRHWERHLVEQTLRLERIVLTVRAFSVNAVFWLTIAFLQGAMLGVLLFKLSRGEP